MTITKLMGEIYEDYEKGTGPSVLAVRYHMSKGSIMKNVNKVKEALNEQKDLQTITKDKVSRLYSSNPNRLKWNSTNIKEGIDKFIAENGRMPTATDFDETLHLPSARQMQRAFGGLVKLRTDLGYKDVDFTRGELRKVIATSANRRGVTAEEYFEQILIAKFGEPFVHVQKRYYKGSRFRYDFAIYCENKVFGIDIFTTDRTNYIEKNIRHKITRYKHAPKALDIYFVLIGNDFTQEDVMKAEQSIKQLSRHPNFHTYHEKEFIKLLESFTPLSVPDMITCFSSLA